MPEKVELSGITKQIMPGPLGDLEEWQTQEVNVTRGEAEGDLDYIMFNKIIYQKNKNVVTAIITSTQA